MTADLRAAAARIRDLAAGATPGPWHADGLYKLLPGCRCLSCDEDEPWAYTLRGAGWQLIAEIGRASCRERV